MPVFGKKNYFFCNNKINDCKRQVNWTCKTNIMFLRQKLWQINSVQTHGHRDGRTDKSMNTEGPIFLTSSCLAFFSLDVELSNTNLNQNINNKKPEISQELDKIPNYIVRTSDIILFYMRNDTQIRPALILFRKGYTKYLVAEFYIVFRF